MTIPPSKIGPSTEESRLKSLERIPWLREDPLYRFKLREIALRFAEVCRFFGVKEEFTKEEDDGSVSESDDTPKRNRISSDDSIVAPKQPRQVVVPARKEEEAPVVSSNEWECKKCTFLNSNSVTSCGICGWFKPRSDEMPASKPVGKRDYPVELFIRSRQTDDDSALQIPTSAKKDDIYAEILSRGLGGAREQQLTGKSTSSSDLAECTIYASPFNLLASGQAQEESTWINALEKDVFAQHSLDEELLFTKRYLAAKKMCAPVATDPILPVIEDRPFTLQEIEVLEKQALSEYSSACNAILGTSLPQITFEKNLYRLSWEDWKLSGVHSEEFLSRLQVIHSELIKETTNHYDSIRDLLVSLPNIEALFKDETIGTRIAELLLSEPRCDLNMHCLSHVEGDNLMDRFLIPAAMERADLIFTALRKVWNNSRQTGFIAARPPGHHCPSFEDRLIGLTTGSSNSSPEEPSDESKNLSSGLTKLEKQICQANGLCEPPREHGMGFCALNALAVAVKRFLQIHNPEFERLHKRSIRIAILDLDIHAGNGTELVFRDNRSVLHISFHRYGFLQGSERVMPGTHYYKDVGGIFGKCQKRPKGEGYAVNITLRKADGNAEVLSVFEGVALPIMEEFDPDVVVVACGFDGLKLSPVFKKRWGEGSCPGMDTEYTPSLYGYMINRVRDEIQPRVVAATEGGYDPLSVGLAARSVVRALKGVAIPKPPLRVFNSDWLPQLNNIFQLQQTFWSSLG
jgi:acetoin utilization deacetylase AcuC-like enzyme